MTVTTTEAFAKRHITREDGIEVLSRPLITVAAMEAGYHLASPAVDEAVAASIYPGQMTEEEFIQFCEEHKASFVSAEDMANAVVVVAPSNVITRNSLQEITKKSSSSNAALTDEEVDALFTNLDHDNKGAITAEDFMRAMYGEEGALCLAERRKMDAEEGAKRIAQKEAEEKQRAEAERKRKEAEAAKAKAEAAAREEKEKQKETKEKKKEKTTCGC